MFPVTRQVRRKRTPVFGRPGRTRGARMRARRTEESGGRLEREQRRARAKQGLGRARGVSGGEQGGGLGEHVRIRQAKRTVGPRTGRPPVRAPADSGGRTPAPRGTNDAIRPTPPPSQKCRGRSAGTPLLHGVRITRELRRRVTSARPRTPRRCWREYARAH